MLDCTLLFTFYVYIRLYLINILSLQTFTTPTNFKRYNHLVRLKEKILVFRSDSEKAGPVQIRSSRITRKNLNKSHEIYGPPNAQRITGIISPLLKDWWIACLQSADAPHYFSRVTDNTGQHMPTNRKIVFYFKLVAYLINVPHKTGSDIYCTEAIAKRCFVDWV